jgi:hypothetical protein
MRELGLNVQLAATEEDGTIEENAEIIGRIVRSESRTHSKLILVSTSKAGPETALALGRILRPDETTSVRAWLSVGGLIRGTPLASTKSAVSGKFDVTVGAASRPDRELKFFRLSAQTSAKCLAGVLLTQFAT